MFSVKFEGLDELAKNSESVARALEEANVKVSSKSTLLMVGAAKRIVRRKKGDLSRSINIQSIEIMPGSVEIEYGSKLPYALIHELGGYAGRQLASYISPHPYLMPSLVGNFAIALGFYSKAWKRIESKYGK